MIADQYIRIVEDSSLNGAAVELANTQTREVIVLKDPHVDGSTTERSIQYFMRTPGLKDYLTPSGVSTKVDRSKINLKGKIALVTGASRKDGIGFNVAATLCELG